MNPKVLLAMSKKLQDEIEQKINHDVPEWVVLMAHVRTGLICELFWDHLDTVINLAAIAKRQDLKDASRKIRKMRRGYEQCLTVAAVNWQENFTHSSEAFLDCFDVDFQKLTLSLRNLLNRQDTTKDESNFRLAVQQAITLGQAVLGFGRHVDKIFRSYGTPLPDDALTLVLPHTYWAIIRLQKDYVIGDYEDGAIRYLRATSAGIFINRLVEIGNQPDIINTAKSLCQR